MRYILAASLLVAVAMPAQAQMMSSGMRTPSMKQCQMGYKRSYMRSMNWSRSAFRDACSEKMMMMKKKKMM